VQKYLGSEFGAIYSRENRVFSYYLNTREIDPFLEDAVKPVFLTPP
jgi:hypothetical protein